MLVVSEKRKANRATTIGGIMRASAPSSHRARKGTLVKDAYKRRQCQEFNAFGFSGRTAHAGLSAGTVCFLGSQLGCRKF
jgi:hypothetical protein